VIAVLLPAEAAAMLRVTESTLAHWRSRGRGPAYVKAGGLVRYRSADIDRYLEEQTHGPEEHARQVAIPIPGPRPGRVRNARLGGHRTKQDKARDVERD
jgi:predicted DNA-binding transcriptional regulator AlpA